jgi:FixJ family two-component response regulator
MRQIRGGDFNLDIPVIMLTGQAEKHVILESRKAGAVDFVAKPFNRDILLNKVAQHIKS